MWESYGVFDYALPFLLIFAVVFGILSFMKIFGNNKGVNVIIALVVGFMAIRFGWFNQFYAELFPRLGIGVVTLLAVLILVGLFIPEDERRYWGWGLAGIAVIIGIIVIYQTFLNLGWGIYGFGGEAVGWIILGVLFLAIIIAVATSGGGDRQTTPASNFGKALMKGFFEPA